MMYTASKRWKKTFCLDLNRHNGLSRPRRKEEPRLNFNILVGVIISLPINPFYMIQKEFPDVFGILFAFDVFFDIKH